LFKVEIYFSTVNGLIPSLQYSRSDPRYPENSLPTAQTFILRFFSPAVMGSTGRKDEKGETVTFSAILTIFYRSFFVPDGERPQGLGFIR
jgi:hypothetical protein